MHDHRTNRTRRVRAAQLLAVGMLSITAMLSMTSCKSGVTWRLGKTHGAIVEPGAGRASLGIYRTPSRALFQVYRGGGTKAAQDVLWAVGQPPVASVRVNGISLSSAALNRKIHGYIYGDAADFRGALIDAENNRDCLALTLISHGAYIKNWTHKSVGCQKGSL